MASNTSSGSNNIRWIGDPNSVNINPEFINTGIPQYQDMHIFAELKGVRKGRSVLVSSNGGATTAIESTGLENTIKVNFLGINQNENNPNYLKFTTNYYDGSTGNQTQYESFGITSIRIVVNSSFIPQINIQFVDVRGLSFFNQEKSPYRILFDFPPPIFELSIKGYYGKALSYKLHLVKYTTEFKADNGNFIIDAQFIGVTFAPLTDILFRYVINFPLMNNAGSENPDTAEPPKNTNDLISKLKNLYSRIEKKLKTSAESKKYDTTLTQIAQNAEVIAILNKYNNSLTEKNNVPYLLIRNIGTPTPANPGTEPNANSQIIVISNLLEYDMKIKSLSTSDIPSKMTDRLYVAYIIGENKEPILESDEQRINTLGTAMNNYKTKLLNDSRKIISSITILDTDISEAKQFSDNLNAQTNRYNPDVTTKYIGIDVTDFYLKLYKQRIELQKTKADVSGVINDTINNMVVGELGMRPTIYNVFKIILDDVDKFFQEIRDTSKDAENRHHKQYYSLIANDSQFKDYSDKKSEKIFAFPLVVNRERICGGIREERVAPIDISKKLPEPFPELKLVDKFVQTFRNQEILDQLSKMKTEQNDDGSYKWIPISPADSAVFGTDIQSPYKGIDTTGGGSTEQPINLSSDKRLSQIMKIVLKRFYILSQSTYPESFYNSNSRDVRDAYIKLYAEAEATNLAASVTQSEYGNNLKTIADSFGTKLPIESFYTYLNDTKELKSYYDFTQAERPFFPMYGESTNDSNVYVNKNNSEYRGAEIYEGEVIVKNPAKGSSNPIDTFQKDIHRGFWGRIFKGGRLPESFYNFTEDNVLFIRDIWVKNDGSIKETKNSDGIHIDTRYVADTSYLQTTHLTPTTKATYIDNYLNNGNSQFIRQGYYPASNTLKEFDSPIDVWTNQLSHYDTEIIPVISGVTNFKLGALLFLSNFGYTLGAFNIYPKKLNELIFVPAVIETPAFVPIYIGALVDIMDGDTNYNVNKLKDFFTTGAGKELNSGGFFIFADIHDINNYMCEKDKQYFRDKFNDFCNNNYSGILSNIISLYEAVNVGDKSRKEKEKAYEKFLDPDDGDFFKRVMQPLLKQIYIINYSQITFKNATSTQTGYISLKELNNDSDKKEVNDVYFQRFFRKLAEQISIKEEAIKERENASEKLKGDKDIITQTYYSFKNINDKWLSNPDEEPLYGYPFNVGNRRLIDSFVFVDRAMNPIGDTIINPEILIDLYDDTTVSVYSVLSQLLSMNGFEFFPLQNFMTFRQEKSWEESFKIDASGNIENPRSTFVCMFIGGSSSYPSGIDNGFIDDGIEDISSTDALDFRTNENCQPVPTDDNQVENNQDFPYREVNAFRVRFGEQNQSMFTDIKIDSKEYPETNESIQILSRLAGDNKVQAPIPKGQNLYNLYENRAYRATVTGLGNAMIQPTQYFQLDNVPVFNGAYLILSVEHQIEPNKMTTSFSGTKILKYPVPRVLNPAAIFGFDGGSSENTSISDLSTGQIAMGLGSQHNPNKAKYNSMYEFNIV